ISAALALLALGLGQLNWLQAHGVSALTLAILLGIVAGNSFFSRMESACGPGVLFARQRLLRLGIVLYGLRLTLQDIAQVGVAGVLIDALVLSSTFALALLVGGKLLRLERATVLLIGAGSAICGAAAVLASEPVVRARNEQSSIAVSSVVLFGTLAMILYPLLYRLNLHWQLLQVSGPAFGIYTGSTIHEVAQVLVAARMIGADALDTAVITKMVRVMMLAPFLLMLSAYCQRRADGVATQARKLALPWFALAFVAVVVLNSIVNIPPAVRQALLELDTLLLALAMAALGLVTRLGSILAAGYRPLLLAGVLAVWLMLGGALINGVVLFWLK
ncbi:MAG: YeiH family protein, partial [Burkholderiales bacterium]|nr:YeiH family protein [Burkholderiales bacterium]